MTPHAPLPPAPEWSTPAAPGLYLSVCPSADEVLVTVRGEIDFDSTPHLRNMLAAVLCSYEGPVALDLAGVTFCDCSGLNEFLRARHQAEGRIIIRASSCPVGRLLELTGTAVLFGPPGRDPQERRPEVHRAAPDQEPRSQQAGTARDFAVHLQHIGDTLLITLHGDLALRRRPGSLQLPVRTVAVVVDLRDVPFVDLSGLRFLAELEKSANEQGAVLLTTGWQAAPLRLAETVARSRRAIPVLSRYVRMRRTRELRAALSCRTALHRALGIADARGWKASAAALATTCTPVHLSL
ncbi:STAS domain-containing protein, partial [Streptomyces sp. NPDC059956]|uniref:STAS domain-containing protein n=1 Tax=Streptomyces sp. NPDC059956 TaxID=3347015 RepID=UPI00364687FC